MIVQVLTGDLISPLPIENTGFPLPANIPLCMQILTDENKEDLVIAIKACELKAFTLAHLPWALQ